MTKICSDMRRPSRGLRKQTPREIHTAFGIGVALPSIAKNPLTAQVFWTLPRAVMLNLLRKRGKRAARIAAGRFTTPDILENSVRCLIVSPPRGGLFLPAFAAPGKVAANVCGRFRCAMRAEARIVLPCSCFAAFLSPAARRNRPRQSVLCWESLHAPSPGGYGFGGPHTVVRSGGAKSLLALDCTERLWLICTTP
jgi:hypothetical protein